MSDTPAPTRGRWKLATIVEIVRETPNVKSFRLALPDWTPHLPGQHYDVRLTAPDGYQAQRSYSVASSPLDVGTIELTVDRLEDGEVSTYLHDVLTVGDQLEIRGPFATYFVWRGEAPVLLIGGGSGVVPLMSMLRHRQRTRPDAVMRLVYSVRTAEDVIYADELPDDTLLTYSRTPPPGWSGHVGRITPALLARADISSGTAYLCGSHAFVEAASRIVMHLGFPAEAIRTERFGPTS
jgi:ferredoxin-NADP reductase